MNASLLANFEFQMLATSGKSAALDFDYNKNQLVLRATESASGEIGNGTPPMPFEGCARIVTCLNGVITPK